MQSTSPNIAESTSTMKYRHLNTLHDISSSEFQVILQLSHQLKEKLNRGERPSLLKNRAIALLFEKPSLRTRISFESGMVQLGGNAIYLTNDVGWKQRESIADFVRVLAQYCDALVCRANSHETVEELASHDCMTIINGLTDKSHPCQALADLMTMQEVSPSLAGKHLVFVGDANNVARSVFHACALAGVHFSMLGPAEYGMPQALIDGFTKKQSINFQQSQEAREVLRNADFIYTDVWVSMGQESETEQRKKAFADYQLNKHLMAFAPSHAKILHCLPAHRGSEITDEVIDSCQSIVVQQAGNRMHVQKGLLVWLALQNGQLNHEQLQMHGVTI
jgi:ornithine carbamoyltransferase